MTIRKLPTVVARMLVDEATRAGEILARAETEAQQIRARAHEEGFAAGRLEGHAAGLEQLLAALRPTTREADDENLLLELAIAIARQLLQRELQLDRDVVRDLVVDHLNTLQQRQGLSVIVHPDDAESLRSYLATREPQIAVAEDARISPGGCRIEAPDLLIDATIETRLELLRAALAGG